MIRCVSHQSIVLALALRWALFASFVFLALHAYTALIFWGISLSAPWHFHWSGYFSMVYLGYI